MNKYLSAVRFLALSQTDFGSYLREKYPDLIEVAKEVIAKDKKTGEQTSTVTELDRQIGEINTFLKYVDASDHDARKELSMELEKLAKELQEERDYDWQFYYFKYLYNLSSHQGDEINTNPMQFDAFKAWFLGSKVVDANGNPLVVYHGTGVTGDEFDQFKFNVFPANYFAENKSYAEWFANLKKSKGQNILFRCYLRIVNPLDLSEFNTGSVSYDELTLYIKLKYGMDMPENKMLRSISERWENNKWIWRYFRAAPNWIKYLRDSKDFDGICFYENNPDDQVDGKENVTKAWVTFFDYQIKSADLRNMTFSIHSGKITMNKGGVLC